MYAHNALPMQPSPTYTCPSIEYYSMYIHCKVVCLEHNTVVPIDSGPKNLSLSVCLALEGDALLEKMVEILKIQRLLVEIERARRST